MADLSMTYPKERSETTTSRKPGWWSSYRSRLTPYLFIAPNLLLFSIFVFFPLLYAAYISVHQWSLIDAPEFNGVQNYTRLLSDGQFWQSLTNTVIYSAATVPTSLILGLFLAIGLNRKLAARTLLRSIYFLPVVVSSVATAVIAAWLFNDNYGVINALLKQAGVGPVAWLSSPRWALPSIILTTLWVRIGFCMVVYLAALQSISPSYYEAAVIDGATRPQQFRFVTWPLLRPDHVPAAHPERHLLVPGLRSDLRHDRRRTGLLHHDDRPVHLPGGLRELGNGLRECHGHGPLRADPAASPSSSGGSTVAPSNSSRRRYPDGHDNESCTSTPRDRRSLASPRRRRAGDVLPDLLDVRHGDPAPRRDLQRSGQSSAHRLGVEQFHGRVEPHAVPGLDRGTPWSSPLRRS